jgi:hypothetical protein
MPEAVTDEGQASPLEGQAILRVSQQTTLPTALLALGIVYGDLGTSPLYTLQAVVQTMGAEFSHDVALGMCFGTGSRRRPAPQVSNLIDSDGVTTSRLFTPFCSLARLPSPWRKKRELEVLHRGINRLGQAV